MKLFLLKRRGKCGWDEIKTVVVRAETAQRARYIANVKPKDEGQIWEDTTSTTCQALSEEGKEGVVITDMKNG